MQRKALLDSRLLSVYGVVPHESEIVNLVAKRRETRRGLRC
jgi:hypothetical protein